MWLSPSIVGTFPNPVPVQGRRRYRQRVPSQRKSGRCPRLSSPETAAMLHRSARRTRPATHRSACRRSGSSACPAKLRCARPSASHRTCAKEWDPHQARTPSIRRNLPSGVWPGRAADGFQVRDSRPAGYADELPGSARPTTRSPDALPCAEERC